MTTVFDTLLLCALPASGKSEVRRYLASLSPEECAEVFHLGETVQLDDYPYVHMMRRISQELRALGQDGVFFESDDLPMKEPKDWGTLMALLNEDYADLRREPRAPGASAAAWLLNRYDEARRHVGAPPAFGELEADVRSQLESAIEDEARELWEEKRAGIPEDLEGKTVVIEFARGGPQGSAMPIDPPFGYQYGFAQLSEEILARAGILYIWVTPEESRRKNEERAKPGREGDASILHHGVPHAVMIQDYGTDDMGWLIEQSDRPDTVRVEAHGKIFYLPVGRFDNRVDKTSFIREDESQWARDDVDAIREGLREAFQHLEKAWSRA